MILQTLIVKTVIEAAKRAFWKNGAYGAGAVADVLKVKHTTSDPSIHDELARVIAWVLRGLAVIALVKVAQLAGFDITPYLHDLLEIGTDVAIDAAESAG